MHVFFSDTSFGMGSSLQTRTCVAERGQAASGPGRPITSGAGLGPWRRLPLAMRVIDEAPIAGTPLAAAAPDARRPFLAPMPAETPARIAMSISLSSSPKSPTRPRSRCACTGPCHLRMPAMWLSSVATMPTVGGSPRRPRPRSPIAGPRPRRMSEKPDLPGDLLALARSLPAHFQGILLRAQDNLRRP